MYQTTTALRRIRELRNRVQVVQGGTRAGKTIAIILHLIDIAMTERDLTISVVGETIPFIKRGALRDFLDIMKSHGYYKDENFNKSSLVYTFESGSMIEFFSADQPQRLRGSKRDILYINEANNVTKEAYDELSIRTKIFIILDHNPVAEYWAHTDLPDKDFIVLTYKDNEALDERIVQAIESRRGDNNWWRVYGLGEIGINQGQIFTDWGLIDEVPKEAELKGYGLDFGYTNDPTAIVAVYYYNGEYILDEKVYTTGMSNKNIAEALKTLDYGLVVADSAEPKSIDEISNEGLDIVPANKGQGSVNYGIQLLQDRHFKVTKDSTNLIKELRNYTWKTDRLGKGMNIPNDNWNHALDATRYIIMELEGRVEPGIRWL